MRWLASRSLGRHYTLTVTVTDTQRLVRTGPYRFIRHPGYAGTLAALIGMTLMLGNWLCVASLTPILPALAYRIRLEERLLVAVFGTNYRLYQAETPYRLVPGLL
jgi:protein-S-isoprenylcysteine O-methyltransferase Ste14